MCVSLFFSLFTESHLMCDYGHMCPVNQTVICGFKIVFAYSFVSVKSPTVFNVL